MDQSSIKPEQPHSRLDVFRPTATQAGMVVNALRDPSRGVELEQLVVELDAPLALARVTEAFAVVHARHTVLRSAFRWEGADADGALLQEIVRDVPLEARFDALSAELTLARWLEIDRARGFDAARPPLHRVALLARGTSEPEHGDVIVWSFHHALLDGRSYRRVLEEVLDRLDGIETRAPEGPSFGDYCRVIASTDRAASHAYFAKKLEGASSTPLPIARVTGAARTPIESTLRLEDLGAAIAGAERVGASVANVIQAAWAWVLARRARVGDVVFATTRSGRLPSIDRVEEIVGCLVDTLPLRVRVEQREGAASLLSHVFAENRALRAHDHTPLTDVLASAGVTLGSLVVIERYDLEASMRARSARDATRRFTLHERSDFPLVLAAYQDGVGLRLVLEHDAHALSAPDARLLLEHVAAAIEVLGRAARDDDRRPLAELAILAPGEAERVAGWARGPFADRDALPETGSIVERFTSIGRGRRDEIALRDGRGTEIGRRELLERARRLAAAIQGAGAREQEIVFVLLPRSIHWVAALWGSWIAEGVYVPLDPSWPEERLRAVHDDVLESGAARQPVVITDHGTRELARRALLRAKVIDVDEAWDHPLPLGSSESATLELDAAGVPREPLAYLLYTSGTTGRPKGARLTHRALAAHVEGAIAHYGLLASDRVLQFTSLGFDVSIEEVVPTLVAGARVVLRSDEIAHDLDAFVREIARAGVTVLNLPSAFLHELLVHLERRSVDLPHTVRLVIVGGERPSPESWARLWTSVERAEGRGRAPLRFVNGYGPTEVTITSVVCDVRAAGVPPDGRTELPIGRPFGSCRAYVVRSLDAPTRVRKPEVDAPITPALASIEEPGELWLAGPQVASGYLARPEATAAAFVPDPFAHPSDVHRIAYRTGDLVKLGRRGELVFLGRIDRQIKLRGHRIEPAEIESAILAQRSVRDAVVVLAGEAEARALVAFVTSVGPPIDLDALRSAVAKRLTSVMVPSRFVALAELPLAASGKVDRDELVVRAGRALREVTPASADEPRNDLEAWLRPVFAHVLGRDDVDLERSFFEMGGHSLLAIRLLARLTSERPDLSLSLATLFTHPSIRGLAEALSSASAEAPTLVRLNPRRAEIEGELPLFCVCGVQLYGPLARAMETDRPVYGAFLPIETEAMHGDGPVLDVVTMAREYVALIRRAQPRGPYVLGGVSFGGILAYEMAQALTARGEEVRMLALFDTILPRGLEQRAWTDRARAGLGKLRQGSDALLSVVRKRAAKIEAQVRRLTGEHASVEEGGDVVALRDGVLKAAAEAYDAVIAPYPGRVVIFRAREGLGDGGERVRWDMGWTGLVRADTPVHGVSGDHLGILREPGVGEIARTLRSALARETSR